MREAFSHLREDYTEDELVVVSNHCGDAYSNGYTNYRKNYCSVSGYPTAMVDYIYKQTGTYGTWQQNYDNLKGWIDIQLAKESEATLDFDYFAIGDDIYFETTVNLEEDLTNEWWVWMLVYQTNWDGYEFVVRDGTTTPPVLQISSAGESDSYYWGFDPTGWDTSQLVGVCFLEKNHGDKEIVQAKMVHLDFGSMQDTRAPIVTDVSPEDGKENVRVDTNIKFTLRDDSGINLDTLDFTVTAEDESRSGRAVMLGGRALSTGFGRTGEVSGTLDIDDSDPQSVKCTFTPDEDLPYSTWITCTIAAGLEDTLGYATDDDFVWSFETKDYVRIEETSWGAIKAQF